MFGEKNKEKEGKMCQFFSGIITDKNKNAIYDLDKDSHEDLIEKAGLKDDTSKPNFVRVELLPQDGNVFNHDLKNWKLKLDQDFKPDWFDLEKSEELMKKKLQEVFDKRFIVDDKAWQERKGQRLFIKNSNVIGRENCSIVGWGNCSIVGWGNCSIEGRENCSIEGRENCSIEGRGNCSIVGWENCSIEGRGNSQILLPDYYYQNSKIKDVKDNASVKDVKNNKIIVANPKIKLVRFKKKSK